MDLVQSKDLERILEMNQKFVPMVGKVDLAWFQEMHKKNVTFIMLKEEGLIAGFLLALPPGVNYQSENYQWFERKFESHLYVDRLAVDTAFQNKGYGKELYQYIFDCAKKMKLDRVTCEVNVRPLNEVSLRFHSQLGFKEVGQQETKGGDIRVSLLSKEL